jgi:glycosyltransferase involved in cell wall biosynthesis
VPSVNTVGVAEFPIHHDTAGNDIIAAHVQALKINAVISLYDPLIFKPQIWQNLLWCAWAPVDCEPLNISNEVALRAAHWVWSMSQFGHKQLVDAGFRATYVPHGIDTETYKPIDRRAARAAMAGYIKRAIPDDQYVVVINAANKGRGPSRKNWYGAFRAFKRLVATF